MPQLTTPTFIIGLGGIGNLVARLVWERYSASGEALPSTVRIRSIDTAGQTAHPLARPLPDSMFTRLGQFQANEVVQHLELFPAVQRWWKYPSTAFTPGFIDNGAGARRPVGRLVFFKEFAKVLEAIRGDLAGPKSDVVQRELIEAGFAGVSLAPRVFIIGSLAGGTGAGTFLDVAFLTRHLFHQLGYQQSAGTIAGVFGLPSVIHLASGDPDSTQARERQVNTIGALSELDFLIPGWAAGALELDYPQPVGRFQPQPPVFNQVYLFTDRRLRGVTFSHQADVLQRVAHFVFSQIALGMGQQTLTIIDNFKKYFDPSQQRVSDGLSAIYSAFGVEWLEVPHERLTAAWCREIGEEVASGVAELQWGQETRRNLDKVVRDRLTGRHESYRQAIEIAEASPDNIFTLRGAPDVQAFLGSIQSASTKNELRHALQSFDTQLPGLLDGLRRQARNLPSPEEDEAWARACGADMVQSQEFRAGGARRVLEKAVDLLGLISASVQGVEQVEDVLKRCGGSWFRRLDTSPALDWARRRVVQQVQQVAKAEFGGRAATLASYCSTLAELMSTLQQAVRSEGPLLGQNAQGGWTPPSDSWMLDDDDIQRAIKDSRSVVIDMVVAAASQALAADLRDAQATTAADARATFAERFKRVALEALEREAVKLTRRPDDTLKRIQTRVATCEPMAHIITDGPDFLRTMPEALRATPLKIVLTNMPDEQRLELDRWVQEQRTAAGDPNAFQVAVSPDSLRDDALYLTFGWPLWLFNEVRACQDATDLMTRDNRNAVVSSRVLGEFPKAARHEIRPMASDRSDLIFAYAFVMGHVRPLRADLIEFLQETFPGQSEASSLKAAADQFKREGLNRTFEDTLRRAQSNGRTFKTDVTEALGRIDAGLAGGAVPDSLIGEIRKLVELVRVDLQQVVAL